jgi:hypothetical protein
VSKQRVSALVLDLGGAPETHHIVPGLPGLYHPSEPTPLPDGISAAQAKELHADEGVPLKLVYISERKADERREQLDQVQEESRTAMLAARRDPASGEELDRINDEAAAVSGQE